MFKIAFRVFLTSGALLAAIFFTILGSPHKAAAYATLPPPVVTIIAPVASSTVSGSVQISAQVVSSSPIASIQYQIDSTVIAGNSTTTTWDTTVFSNGNHTITVTATDTNGGQDNASEVVLVYNPPQPTPIVTPSPLPGSSVNLLNIDTTTQGNWQPIYGADGEIMAGDATHLPAYVGVVVNGPEYTWASSTTDIRALQKFNKPTDRIAATWYSTTTQFTINLNFKDQNVHTVAAYFLDYDSTARDEIVSFQDPVSHQTLDAHTVSGFNGGTYYVWNIRGPVIMTLYKILGANPVVSALFFGGPPPPGINFFSAKPATITAGQPVTLSWNTTGATALSIDNGVGTVTGLTSKIVYPTVNTTYTLTATNSGGISTSTAAVMVKPNPQGPTSPILTSAVAASPTEVDLAWMASSDKLGISGYKIVRNGTVINLVAFPTLNYIDTTVSASTTYAYTIEAYDSGGNISADSNALQVTTPALPTVGYCPGPATNAFTGCYYNNSTLTGNRALVRTDSAINFNWRNTSPSPLITSPANFSARWQGNFSFTGGTQIFYAVTSDGMRIYIDGSLVLDSWRIQPPYEYRIVENLAQGTHLITVEYFNTGSSATAELSW